MTTKINNRKELNDKQASFTTVNVVKTDIG